MQHMTSFEFAGHILDLQQGRLRKGGADVALRRKSLSLLTYLVQNSGRVLGKDELVTAIWPDVEVSDDSLAQCMKDIRKALGSEGVGFIRTVPRRGYIVDDVRVHPLRDELAAPNPSVAVLPFAVMSNEPEQEFFADGLVEDILTTLSKLSGLSVIAHHSSFAYKGGTVDIRQVAHELGVRFVVEGGVQKSGDRLRITVQLIDTASGTQVWAERFDGSMKDLFAVQDEITLTLATEMQVRLTEGEQARLRYTTTTNVDAWNLWIRGLNHSRGSHGTDFHVQACRCWEKALTLDPNSAPLMGMLAFRHFSDARHGWTEATREASLSKAEAYVERALAIDPDNPDAHRAAAGILLLRLEFENAAIAARRAANLGPSMADVLGFSAFVLASCGRAGEAIGHAERAIKLSPKHPGWYFGVLGNAYRLAGRLDAALAAFRGYHAREPGYGLADIVMIQEQTGLTEEARATAKQLAILRPSFTVASFTRTQFRSDSVQLAADIVSLRAAGVQEG
jgi:adenylate cyclase